MRIGAILSLSEDQQGVADYSASPGNSRREMSGILGRSLYARFDILGQTLLDRAIAKLQQFGVSDWAAILEEPSEELLPSRTTPSAFVEAWENTVAKYLAEGLDQLLLVRVSGYNDLDYVEFVKFHLENKSAITQAYAADGALDVALVDTERLRAGDGAYRRALGELIPQQCRFLYRGYNNRLENPADFHQVVQDGLQGRCGLAPIGKQTRELVWQGPDSEIAESAVVTGPVFIGAGSRIAACCTIASGSSVERDCEVDCGTIVEDSWVTQGTYLGLALDVRRSIVAQDTLFRVDRNIELKIADRDLIGAATKSAPLLAGLASLFGARMERQPG